MTTRISLLTRDEVYGIRQTAFDVLENVGVKFNHDEGLPTLRKGGAHVDSKAKIEVSKLSGNGSGEENSQQIRFDGKRLEEEYED